MVADRRLAKGWAIQIRNIRAIALRDLMMRYGRDNIGFVWVVLEPMILTAGVMGIWTLLNGSHRSGIRIVEFVLTGYMPLTLWRHLSNNMISVFRRSNSLLFHRSVTLLDISLARLLLEFLGTTTALVVVWAVLNALGLAGEPAQLGLLVTGWLMMALVAGGVGLIIAAASEYSDTTERFIQPLQYLLIPISGAFSLVEWLPAWAQRAILFNPTVHCYEVFRAGFFGPSVATHYSFSYFFLCALPICFIGLVGLEWSRDRVQLN